MSSLPEPECCSSGTGESVATSSMLIPINDRLRLSPEAGQRPNRSQTGLWPVATLLVLMAMLLGTVAAHGQSAPSSQNAGVRDFVAYWAATRLLLNVQDPYSPPVLFELQRRVGWQEAQPLVMWNPPWTLSFTLPFGFIGFSTGQFLWLLSQVFLILISASLFWRLYGNSKESIRWPWFLTLTFVPTVFALVLGQIAPLVLASIAAFSHFEEKENDVAAGVFLVLASVKPHLIYLFWFVLLLWIYHHERWRVALGAAAAGLVAATLPLLFDSMIYAKYLALFQRADLPLPMDLAAPTLRNAGVKFFQTGETWLRIVPTVGACIWSVYYWHCHRQDWHWAERLPLILLVSLVTSPWTWTFDQIVFVPAVLQGATWAIRRERPWFTSAAVILYAAIDMSHCFLRFFVAEDFWYFWLAPALLVNYLIFRWEAGKSAGG